MTKSKLPAGLAVFGLLMAVLLLGRPTVQAEGAGPVLTVGVMGPNITFTWTAVPGASSYTLRAGVASGQFPPIALNVGNTTTYAATAPFPAAYFASVDANVNGAAVPSTRVDFSVTTMFVPPAAPANLTAYINGTSALIAWSGGTGGGSPSRFVLYAGSSPGAADVGVFPLPASTTQLPIGNVPRPRTYYLRVVAENPGGPSPASNEAILDMPADGGCSAPPARTFTPAVFGRYVQLSWIPVPGASGYRLDFKTPSGSLSQPVAGNASRFSASNVPLGVYSGTLTTAFSCGQQTTGAEATITVDGAPPPGPRAPNPAPGTRLGFPGWGAAVVEQLAAERPDLLGQSCHEQPGGNNRFMFEAVRRLRARDNRFGLNWKRGNFGDLSQDIVTYNPTDQPDEGNRAPYIIDIIGGHCGPRPTAAWIDQTAATRNAGTIGIWTLIPYLDAGYPIVSDPQQ